MHAFVILCDSNKLFDWSLAAVGHQVPSGHVGMVFFTEEDAKAGLEFIFEHNKDESSSSYEIRKVIITLT